MKLQFSPEMSSMSLSICVISPTSRCRSLHFEKIRKNPLSHILEGWKGGSVGTAVLLVNDRVTINTQNVT